MPLWAIEPKPRHSKNSTRLKYFGQGLERLAVAVSVDDAAVLIFDLGAAFVDLLDDHIDRLQNIERLKARDDERFAVFAAGQIRNTAFRSRCDT